MIIMFYEMGLNMYVMISVSLDKFHKVNIKERYN
jgi:hypothetical protein